MFILSKKKEKELNLESGGMENMRTNNKSSSDKDNNGEHVEKRTKLDEFKDQQMVDDIPLEDLKIEQKDERKKSKTKDESQSERKYKKDEK